MRLQQIREGQRYLTRTNSVLTVVAITEAHHPYNHFEVAVEQGGVITHMRDYEFRTQVHHLVADSRIPKVTEFRQDLFDSGKLEYKHGEIWADKNYGRWMCLRTLRSGSSRPAFIKLDVNLPSISIDPGNPESIKVAKEIDIYYKLTEVYDYEPSLVMFKGDICSIEAFNHSSVLISFDDQITGEYKKCCCGFGNICAWEEGYEESDLQEEIGDLRDAIWAGGLQDPHTQKILHKIEYQLTEARWG